MRALAGAMLPACGFPFFNTRFKLEPKAPAAKGPVPLVTCQRIGSGRAGEQGSEALGDEVRQQVPPIAGHGQTFPVQEDAIVRIQIDVRVRIRGNPDAQFPGIRADDG
jgi:hypothetical protein